MGHSETWQGPLRHLPLLISVGFLGHLGMQYPHGLLALLLKAPAHAFPQDHGALWGGPGSGGRERQGARWPGAQSTKVE